MRLLSQRSSINIDEKEVNWSSRRIGANGGKRHRRFIACGRRAVAAASRRSRRVTLSSRDQLAGIVSTGTCAFVPVSASEKNSIKKVKVLFALKSLSAIQYHVPRYWTAA